MNPKPAWARVYANVSKKEMEESSPNCRSKNQRMTSWRSTYQTKSGVRMHDRKRWNTPSMHSVASLHILLLNLRLNKAPIISYNECTLVSKGWSSTTSHGRSKQACEKINIKTCKRHLSMWSIMWEWIQDHDIIQISEHKVQRSTQVCMCIPNHVNA